MSAGAFVFSFFLSGSVKLILAGYAASSINVPLLNYNANWANLSIERDDNIPPEYLHLFLHHLSEAPSVYANNDNSAMLRFFYDSMSNYTELPLSEAHKIFSYSWYNPAKTTVFFSHGYTGHPKGPAVTTIMNYYLKEGLSNVVLFNWQHMASMIYPSFVNSYMNWAAPNAIRLGNEFANTLLKLSAAGLDLDKTHLLGHSLGAHMFGVTGNKIQEFGVKLPWITGLDPASAGFDVKPPHLRLQPNSALFVSVIHSDPSRYGTKRELGTVDFWPNYRNRGQVLQTGCPPGSHQRFSKEDLCNHNRSWQFLLDALKYPGTIIGTYAKNFRIWKNYSKDEKNAEVLELGTFNPNAKPGNYYLITAGESPYGLGKNGL
ncbi:phospholipase A1 [Manduca sexta]|uniref:Esterase n=1 Tax=Manduca sexta TaxID=7130 RepID=A0A921ZJJ7_MANSE|nr:phospholipase A1 [Manduca sexta]XP_037298473.1 phospholipase A1 [Manduca sexta]KAG6459207.1 hypothetical protein O3G_MSEX011273 [Manduca sexta]UXP71911.1 esterase [Manduca sexta]